jgi:Carboxypeptidase regulatory-like domain
MSPPEAIPITGVVRDATGTPSAGIIVSLTAGPVALPDIAAVTGEGGEFAFGAPVPGEYVVTVSYPDGHQESRVAVVADSKEAVHVDISRRRPPGRRGRAR